MTKPYRKNKPLRVARMQRLRRGVSDRHYLRSPRSLSKRELEVFPLLLEGRTNREIALALRIKFRTARSHVSSILRKFGVRRRSELLSELWLVPRQQTREEDVGISGNAPL